MALLQQPSQTNVRIEPKALPKDVGWHDITLTGDTPKDHHNLEELGFHDVHVTPYSIHSAAIRSSYNVGALILSMNHHNIGQLSNNIQVASSQLNFLQLQSMLSNAVGCPLIHQAFL